MSKINLTVEQINQLNPLEIVQNEQVRDRFIQIYETLWGNGEAAYEREAIFFNKHLVENEKLQKATKFSLFTTFIDLAVSGLSLEGGVRSLCYIQGRNVCIGKDEKGNKKYEGQVTLTISGYGELVMRERAGQIRHADNPVIVYEEDSFSFSDTDGRKSVSYTCKLPHTSQKIIACFMRITRNDGSIDYGVMFPEDWGRLRDYSAENNKKWDAEHRCYVKNANTLYTKNNGDIDQGFLIAKCIKHAFKTYPKVKIGRSTILETEHEEEEEDYYGVEEPEKQESFDQGNDLSKGVVIEQQDDNSEIF